MTLTEAERDYRLLEWCDALSLLLCQRENQPEARAVEISNGADNKSYQMIQTATDTLTVAPWPFELTDFKLYYETRLIPQLTFKDTAEFRSAFLAAKVSEKHWRFQRSTL